MKLSTRVRYGSRALVCIAASSVGRPIPLQEIARKEHISLKYLESIIASLKAAGLLQSVRGAQGGYVLKKPITDITLQEIVYALGGKLRIVDCVSNQQHCDIKEECAMFEIWNELNEVIEEKLQSIKLSDIVRKKREKSGDYVEMYHI